MASKGGKQTFAADAKAFSRLAKNGHSLKVEGKLSTNDRLTLKYLA